METWTRGFVGWYIDTKYAWPNPNAPKTTELVVVQMEEPVGRTPITESPERCPSVPTNYAYSDGASAGYFGLSHHSNPYRFGDNSFQHANKTIPVEMWPACADAWDAGFDKGAPVRTA